MTRLFDPAWQAMPRSQLDALHLERIRQLIAFAYKQVPFYRRRYDEAGLKPSDIVSWDDFYSRVPVIDKPDLGALQSANGPVAAAGVPLDRHLHYFQTSGTTGAPLAEIYDLDDQACLALSWASSFYDLGLQRGDSIYLCYGFGVWVGLWSVVWGARLAGLRLITGGGLSTEQRLAQIMDMKPTMVMATPTYLLHLGHMAAASGIDLPSAGVRALGGGGESGLSIPSLRAWLYEGWGSVRLLDAYGISELAWCANSCLACDGAGVHPQERTHHSYSADPVSGEPVGEGEVGENIVTSFRLGQILIKYRTHDLVRRVRHHDHGCGLSYEFLEGSVLSRTDSMVTIRGVNVYPTAVENIVGSVGGTTPYFEIHIHRDRDLDGLQVRLEAADHDQSGFDELSTAVADRLRRHLGLRVDVEVLASGSLPRYESKSKRIFDHRKEA